MKLNFLFSFQSSPFRGPPSINTSTALSSPTAFPSESRKKEPGRGKTHPMLLLMHFRSHLITCHIIHSYHMPALISLTSTSPFVCSASTPPIEQPQYNPETERQKFVTHHSPLLQNAIKTISAPRTRKTGTHTYKKNRGQAGIGKEKNNNLSLQRDA